MFQWNFHTPPWCDVENEDIFNVTFFSKMRVCIDFELVAHWWCEKSVEIMEIYCILANTREFNTTVCQYDNTLLRFATPRPNIYEMMGWEGGNPVGGCQRNAIPIWNIRNFFDRLQLQAFFYNYLILIVTHQFASLGRNYEPLDRFCGLCTTHSFN